MFWDGGMFWLAAEMSPDAATAGVCACHGGGRGRPRLCKGGEKGNQLRTDAVMQKNREVSFVFSVAKLIKIENDFVRIFYIF